MKKFKVVDKKRFTRFVIILVLTVIFITTIFTVDMKAAELKPTVSNSRLQDLLEDYDLHNYTVKPGDTFWNVQLEYLPGEDVRELKFYAEFINDKSMSELQAWDTMYVFTTKGE